MEVVEGLPKARVGLAGKVKDVRGDHVSRYRWAGDRLAGHVIDAGCNCGYGAAILADGGLTVTAIEREARFLDWAREHWHRPTITWMRGDLETLIALPHCDAVVAFEVVEHLENPEHFLRLARSHARRLLVSVPNEAVWPWQPRLLPSHQRHYTRRQLEALLALCGWSLIERWGHENPYSAIERNCDGHTLVADCR